MEWVILLAPPAGVTGSPPPGSFSPASSLKCKKGRHQEVPALLRPLDSGVLNYQEDFVMPGSSPR